MIYELSYFIRHLDCHRKEFSSFDDANAYVLHLINSVDDIFHIMIRWTFNGTDSYREYIPDTCEGFWRCTDTSFFTFQKGTEL